MEILARLERYVYRRNSTGQELVALRAAVWWTRSVAVALNQIEGNPWLLTYARKRALNYQTGTGDVRLIRFDYYRPEIKDMLAGDLLRQDLMLLDLRRSLFLKQRNHIKHVTSLRRHYRSSTSWKPE